MLDFSQIRPQVSNFSQTTIPINLFSQKPQQIYNNQFANYYENSSVNNIQIPEISNLDISTILNPYERKGGLYLGNINSATSEKILEKYEIGAVLTVMQGMRFNYGKKINHAIFPVDDFAWVNLQEYFDKGTQFINDNLEKTNVLVHCFAGISRSASLVIAYLLRFGGMNLTQAYSFTQKQRQLIQPNPGFLQQLKQYEFQLYEQFVRQHHNYRKQQSLIKRIKSFFS